MGCAGSRARASWSSRRSGRPRRVLRSEPRTASTGRTSVTVAPVGVQLVLVLLPGLLLVPVSVLLLAPVLIPVFPLVPVPVPCPRWVLSARVDPPEPSTGTRPRRRQGGRGRAAVARTHLLPGVSAAVVKPFHRPAVRPGQAPPFDGART